MIHEEEKAAKAARMRVYTAITLGLVGVATVIVLGIFAVYIKRQREAKERQGLMSIGVGARGCTLPGAPLANSTMRSYIPPTQSSQLHLRVG
ncbi:unnamed protein product [Nippostrongylus brasiliensis]|uniref:Uncharacterized protein n=1 Tax=Nippostrongylus brasiliensis TaxID=27835 RepID=A0A0N4XSB4_NIPBR|nr:unnamed protein product [Nippostrongylus brasiliensis]